MVSDIQNCVQQTIKALGGLDIIIGNAGFTKFSDFEDLDAMSYEEWDKCWHTNVTGNHALLKEALPTFNSNPDGGILIMTGSVAGKSLSGSSMAYSVTKAAQVHLMKCLANTQGPKVRVNAVLPGLLLTDWGNLYGDERISALKNAAALRQETKLEDCAQAFLDIARNTSMTGQAVHVGELDDMLAWCRGGLLLTLMQIRDLWWDTCNVNGRSKSAMRPCSATELRLNVADRDTNIKPPALPQILQQWMKFAPRHRYGCRAIPKTVVARPISVKLSLSQSLATFGLTD